MSLGLDFTVCLCWLHYKIHFFQRGNPKLQNERFDSTAEQKILSAIHSLSPSCDTKLYRCSPPPSMQSWQIKFQGWPWPSWGSFVPSTVEIMTGFEPPLKYNLVWLSMIFSRFCLHFFLSTCHFDGKPDVARAKADRSDSVVSQVKQNHNIYTVLAGAINPFSTAPAGAKQLPLVNGW